jgi:nucleoside transporter
MYTHLKARLSAFNFLQYFIWGAWYVSMGAYLSHALKFSGEEIGLAYGAFAIGSMISPFFIGLVADRFFASERLLAVLGMLGGAVMCALPHLVEFKSFYPALIIYCALYAPTLALGNSLAFHHLSDSKRDFPLIKRFASLGWIAGGVVLSLFKGEQGVTQWYLAGGASIVFGIYSLTLPHTPPKKTGKASLGEILGLDALGLLRKPSFAIFMLVMFLICIPLYFYFVMAGIFLSHIEWSNIAMKLSLGQVADIVTLTFMPFVLKRFGFKKTIMAGIIAWILRYVFFARSFAFDPSSLACAVLIYSGILLHGICYDFLFIAGMLYVDREANERMRGACQGFIAFILWGVGAFVGTYLAGRVLDHFAIRGADGAVTGYHWDQIWYTPAILSVLVLLICFVFFKETPESRNPEAVDETPGRDSSHPVPQPISLGDLAPGARKSAAD